MLLSSLSLLSLLLLFTSVLLVRLQLHDVPMLRIVDGYVRNAHSVSLFVDRSWEFVVAKPAVTTNAAPTTPGGTTVPAPMTARTERRVRIRPGRSIVMVRLPMR